MEIKNIKTYRQSVIREKDLLVSDSGYIRWSYEMHRAMGYAARVVVGQVKGYDHLYEIRGVTIAEGAYKVYTRRNGTAFIRVSREKVKSLNLVGKYEAQPHDGFILFNTKDKLKKTVKDGELNDE